MRKGLRKRAGQLVRGKSGKTLLGGKSEQTFTQPISIPKVAPRESLDVYWHPHRAGVEPAPEPFASRLTAMHPDLACCRPPGNAPLEYPPAWIVWYRRPRVTHALCPGWLLLFVWRTKDGTPQPLDERVFAVIEGASAGRWGSGANYFKRCVEEKMDDAKRARERAFDNRRKAKQKEFITSTRISTAGTGSKFARHHDGTLAPGRNMLNWHLERRRQLLPSEMIKAEDEARDQRRARAADMAKLAKVQVD